MQYNIAELFQIYIETILQNMARLQKTNNYLLYFPFCIRIIIILANKQMNYFHHCSNLAFVSFWLHWDVPYPCSLQYSNVSSMTNEIDKWWIMIEVILFEIFWVSLWVFCSSDIPMSQIMCFYKWHIYPFWSLCNKISIEITYCIFTF